MSFESIAAGATERQFTVIAKASGDPISSGTVNYYLKARSGDNVDKWWRNSDQTWQVAETANAMTHIADGHWEIDLTTSPFTAGVRYMEYVKESGDLHIPDARHLICTWTADASVGGASSGFRLSAATSVVERMVTFQDAIDRVCDAHNIDQASYHYRAARASVMEAYRELPNLHDWAFLRRRGTLVTEDAQDDGTIAYTHATRTVALTGATWPDDIAYYRIVIDSREYAIERKTSSTLLILREDDNPGEDVAASTTYSLRRPLYPVPADFRRGGKIVQFDGLHSSPMYMPHDELVKWQSLWESQGGVPLYYTLRNIGTGELAFELAPAPDSVDVFHYSYDAVPRALQLFGAAAEYSTGTVTVSSTTVTGSGTQWTDSMVGCIFRPSTSALLPTGKTGRKGLDNPYPEQRLVTEVTSATTLTLSAAMDGTYGAGTKYTLGSPIDLEIDAMLDMFLRRAELQYAILTTKDKEVPFRTQAFQRALTIAFGADYRPGPMQPGDLVGVDGLARPIIVAQIGSSFS